MNDKISGFIKIEHPEHLVDYSDIPKDVISRYGLTVPLRTMEGGLLFKYEIKQSRINQTEIDEDSVRNVLNQDRDYIHEKMGNGYKVRTLFALR